MAGNITTTQLNDSIATIIAAEVLGYLRANCVLAGLVARDTDFEPATKGQTIQIPIAGTLAASDKAQGSAITLQQPADDKVTVTLNKHKESSFLIEDYARTLAKPNWFDIYMQQSIDVIIEQMESDLAALYSGLSQSINATGASGPLDLADFTEARRLLNAAKAPLTNRVAVLHEDAEKQFFAIEEAINDSYRASLGGALAESYTGKFAGFYTFMSQKIATAASECKNLFMHKNALVLAQRPLPSAPQGAGVIQKVMEEMGYMVRVTVSYDHDYLGLKVTVDTLYGVAELRDSHGVVVRTDEL